MSLRPAFTYCLKAAAQRRTIFTVRPLAIGEADPEQNGIGPFLNSESYNRIWTQKQHSVCDQLNTLTAGSELSNLPPHTVALQTARDPAQAAVFNHASFLANNDFFLQGLLPAPREAVDSMDRKLVQRIEKDFRSVVNLKELMISTGISMFGSGFVWLVEDDRRRLRVLATYNAGSPFVEHAVTDANSPLTSLDAHARAMRPYAVMPLLGVSVWEHAWVPQYGIDGKEKYLENWWKQVNWQKVNSILLEGSLV